MRQGDPVLSVRDLVVEFGTIDGAVRAVDGVGFDLYAGETLGIVGESGSGKSVSVMSMLGLTPGRVVSGEVLFEGRDLLTMSREDRRRIRGGPMAMIFQDPMSSLNPVVPVGRQIGEALELHNPDMTRGQRRDRATDLLRLVGVPDPQLRVKQYPFEFSGGMRQRVMIAMAIANSPKVLIADEPTTALDVTIQAQILEVLGRAKQETNSATILITHDLGVIAEMADRVMVMYAGRVIEMAGVHEIFAEPRHPYTQGLMGSVPKLSTKVDRLRSIPGNPPNVAALPGGCSFQPRCSQSDGREICHAQVPGLLDIGGRSSACHFHHELAAAG